MPIVKFTYNASESTIRIFDKFYNREMTVSANEYDVVSAFFNGVCATKQIAENFTAFLFRVAHVSGLDPLTIIDNLSGSNNKLQIDQKFAYYLNSFKSKTSLYGIGIVPRPVQPVARNIVI